MDKNVPLAVFLIIREELKLVELLATLLVTVCYDSTSLERKIPGDPLTSIPVRQDLSCAIRTYIAPFEQADLARLSQPLTDMIALLDRFTVESD